MAASRIETTAAASIEYEALYAGLPESRDRQFIAALPECVLARS